MKQSCSHGLGITTAALTVFGFTMPLSNHFLKAVPPCVTVAMVRESIASFSQLCDVVLPLYSCTLARTTSVTWMLMCCSGKVCCRCSAPALQTYGRTAALKWFIDMKSVIQVF